MSEELNHTLTEPVSGLVYRLREGSRGAGKSPCLILLHGVGANEQGLIELARGIDPRFSVILARGPLQLGPMQFAWFRVSFTANGPAIDTPQAERARTTLLAFIGQLPQAHAIDPQCIWIAGFSQGGIMSASVALSAPQQVAGFGILSGRILPEVMPLLTPGTPLAALHAFVSHGRQDQVLGLHFAHHAKQVLAGLNVRLQYQEYEAGHRLEPAMVADFEQWLGARLADR